MVVVVGVLMATKVGGVNLGLVGVRPGVVQDFQVGLLEAMEVKGTQVVLAQDMGNSHTKTTSVVLSSKVTEEVKEMEVCHLPLVKKKVLQARVSKFKVVQPLPLPWLKMQWELVLRRPGLETGTTKEEEGMATRVGVVQDLQWGVTKVDSTPCLLRSARTRRTRRRRS